MKALKKLGLLILGVFLLLLGAGCEILEDSYYQPEERELFWASGYAATESEAIEIAGTKALERVPPGSWHFVGWRSETTELVDGRFKCVYYMKFYVPNEGYGGGSYGTPLTNPLIQQPSPSGSFSAPGIK